MHYIILSFIALLISTPTHPAAIKKLSQADAELLHAAWSDNVKNAKAAINNGANPNAKDWWNCYTSLHVARDPELVKLLLDAHADVNAKDAENRDPLGYTCDIVFPDTETTRTKIELLIQHNAPVNATSKNLDETALHFASKRCHVAAIEGLLNAKADPNVQAFLRQGGEPCFPLNAALRKADEIATYYLEFFPKKQDSVRQSIFLLLQAGAKLSPETNLQKMSRKVQQLFDEARTQVQAANAQRAQAEGEHKDGELGK